MGCVYRRQSGRTSGARAQRAEGDARRSGDTPPAESGARLFPIVEVNAAVGEQLVGLVPFARDDHEIVVTRQLDCRLDGAATIDLHEQALIRARYGTRAGDDVGSDCLRRLGTRVVRGHDDLVAQLHRDPTHDRSLTTIAIAAAAEHRDDAPRPELAGAAQQALQRIRLVRVIDGDSKVLTTVDQLETPRNGRRGGQSPANVLQIQTERDPDPDGGEGVMDVVVAEMRQHHRGAA